MKKLFFILTAIVLSVSVIAQGNSGNKGKDKQKDKGNVSQNDNAGNSKDKDKEKEDKVKNDEHDRKVWDGVDGGSGCGKVSKNQPAKVRSAFQRDYPNAINVRWTKCRGDWTATFNGLFRSTAIYHANGNRKDTRTPINQDNIPRRVLDEIFKKRPAGSKIDDVIKIEVPNAVKDIFRIKNMIDDKTEFIHLDAEGLRVAYDY